MDEKIIEKKEEAEQLISRLRKLAKCQAPFSPFQVFEISVGRVREQLVFSIRIKVPTKAIPPKTGDVETIAILSSLTNPNMVNVFVGWMDVQGIFSPTYEGGSGNEEFLTKGLVELYKIMTR